MLLMANGYGRVAKDVMTDRRLNVVSKSIYSYICTFAGEKLKAWPCRDRICADLVISKDTFTKYVRQLVEFGYISILKRRTNNGRFKGNLYVIQRKIDVNPCHNLPDMDIEDIKNNSKYKNNNKDRSLDKPIKQSVVKKLQRDVGATPEQVQEAIERTRRASSNKVIHNFIGYTKTTLESIVGGCKSLPDIKKFPNCDNELPNKRLELVKMLYC